MRQAKHTHVSRLQQIEQARTEVQAQVVAAWSQLAAARAQLESDQASVDANRIALAGVREEERVGQRTLLDVLNAEQELLNSEVNLVTTKRNWWWRPTLCCRRSGGSMPRNSAWPVSCMTPRRTTSRCAASGPTSTSRTATGGARRSRRLPQQEPPRPAK